MVIAFLLHFVQFTGNSTRALDSCAFLDNRGSTGVDNVPGMLPDLMNKFADAANHKADNKRQNKFYLLRMSAGPPDKQVDQVLRDRRLLGHSSVLIL